MAYTCFTGLILFTLTAVTHCSEFCLTYNNGNINYVYCEHGCCEYANSRSCCSDGYSLLRRRRSQPGQVVTSSGTGATTMVTGVYPSGTTYPLQTAVVPGYGQPQQIVYSQNANPQQLLQLGAHQMAPMDQTKYNQPPPAYESLH